MEVNKYQTALTDDLVKSLTKEEYENLFVILIMFHLYNLLYLLIGNMQEIYQERMAGSLWMSAILIFWRIWNILGQQVIIIKSMDVIQN